MMVRYDRCIIALNNIKHFVFFLLQVNKNTQLQRIFLDYSNLFISIFSAVSL